MTSNRYKFLWMGAGIALGVLVSFSPGAVFMALLSAATAAALVRFSGPQNRRFLLALFLSALFLRIGVSAGLDALSWKVEGELPYRNGPVQGWNLHISDKTRGYLKIGDSDYFSQRGYATAQFVEGSNEPVLPFRINQYGKHGYIFCIGWFYYLFGFSPCAIKLINCFLGSLTAVLVFLLGRRCFGTAPARWASVLTAVFPSFILWSATNLKDIPLTFFTLLILVLYSQLIRAKRWRSRLVLFLLLLVSLRVHMTFRSVELSIILAGSLLAVYLLARSIRAQPVRTAHILLVLSVLGIRLSFWEPVGVQIRRVLGQLFNWHIGFCSTPGSSYCYLPAAFYTGNYRLEWVETGHVNGTLLLGMGQAVLHYLFEPFPWNISNLFQWFVYFQLIIWYALFPFAVIGLILALRKKQENTLALVLTAVAFTGIGALASGNIGTVFRQRDLVTPLFLILGCAGLYQAVRQPYIQGSLALRLLSHLWAALRRRLESAIRKSAQMLRNGPVGQSLRYEPLRSIGISGVTALITQWALTQILGRTPTDWMENARMAFGTIALLAIFHRGSLGRVMQGSQLLRFLRRA